MVVDGLLLFTARTRRALQRPTFTAAYSSSRDRVTSALALRIYQLPTANCQLPASELASEGSSHLALVAGFEAQFSEGGAFYFVVFEKFTPDRNGRIR